jgi:hypothetical protein
LHRCAGYALATCELAGQWRRLRHRPLTIVRFLLAKR